MLSSFFYFSFVHVNNFAELVKGKRSISLQQKTPALNTLFVVLLFFSQHGCHNVTHCIMPPAGYFARPQTKVVIGPCRDYHYV